MYENDDTLCNIQKKMESFNKVSLIAKSHYNRWKLLEKCISLNKLLKSIISMKGLNGIHTRKSTKKLYWKIK